MLTRTQKNKVKEIDHILDILGLNHRDVESFEDDAILLVLKSMKDHHIRGEIVMDYALIDELLGSIISHYFFDKKKSFVRLWRTKKFKNFNYYILERIYLGQKLDLVENIIKIPDKIKSTIRKINDLRNALAHTFFPENLRVKRLMYDGKNIYTLEGLKKYIDDRNRVTDFLIKKAYGVDVEGYDFRR